MCFKLVCGADGWWVMAADKEAGGRRLVVEWLESTPPNPKPKLRPTHCPRVSGFNARGSGLSVSGFSAVPHSPRMVRFGSAAAGFSGSGSAPRPSC